MRKLRQYPSTYGQYLAAFKMWLHGNLSYSDCLYLVKHCTIYMVK